MPITDTSFILVRVLEPAFLERQRRFWVPSEAFRRDYLGVRCPNWYTLCFKARSRGNVRRRPRDYCAVLNLKYRDYDRDDHGPQDETRRPKGNHTTEDRKEYQQCV